MKDIVGTSKKKKKKIESPESDLHRRRYGPHKLGNLHSYSCTQISGPLSYVRHFFEDPSIKMACLKLIIKIDKHRKKTSPGSL